MIYVMTGKRNKGLTDLCFEILTDRPKLINLFSILVRVPRSYYERSWQETKFGLKPLVGLAQNQRTKTTSNAGLPISVPKLHLVVFVPYPNDHKIGG